MNFDEARFKNILSELGLSSSLNSGKHIQLYQGKFDTVVFEKDVLRVYGGDIREAYLRAGTPKISFQELDSIIALSARIKDKGFPPLLLNFTVKDKITGVEATLLGKIPDLNERKDELLGLPASAGEVSAKCLVYPSKESCTGKIIVMKNSKELHTLMKEKPAGIILEEGNLLSHASILAREAGIPAIVKVQDALKILKTGDEVHLDGTRGWISIRRPR